MTDKPKITLLDIENSPVTIHTWGTYKQNALKVLERSKIISVAWKELLSNVCSVKAICDYPNYKAGVVDDEELIKDVWKILDESDVIIAQNGDSFDLKKLNTAFVIHGLPAPSPYETVDTLKVAKKYFRFDSNKLNDLGQYLGVGQKVDTGGFDLWMRCMSGDKKAWASMKEYNMGDVILLENVYLKMRPYIFNHPNLSLIMETSNDVVCTSCLSSNIQKRGFSTTRTTKKQRFQCTDCGSWSTGPTERVKAP